VPYLHPFDPDEPVGASPILWIAIVGPVLATVLVWRAQYLLPVEAGGVFGAVLVGLGLLNMAWGSIASWATQKPGDAWRYSFVADWGLVLSGLGLTLADGHRAALLILFSVVLGRLPLYMLSREETKVAVTEHPVNLVAAALLAGSAPFAGFAARVLLLRGATQLFWPLAVALAAVMLLWLPGSLRLGRSLGLPRRRAALCVVVVVVLNVAAGLYPLPLLSAAGL
jgi:formate hydrogenlyase subunit 3/multisubunit Na+/H+ antiporter MnhD subunit